MSGLPLPSLLSPALVAFTIEFDNEAESRMAHQTTLGGRQSGGPWLVSQVMWANVIRHIPDQGCALPELHRRARTARDSLSGLQRWGYLSVEPPDGGADPVVHLTAAGRRARQVWQPLASLVEGRWSTRFGQAAVDRLRSCLGSVVEQIGGGLPDYLPPVYPAKGGRAEEGPRAEATVDIDGGEVELSTLLSQTLLAFTLDFESRTPLSLAMRTSTLRVVDAAGVRVGDLPRLTGVSKEANQMCIGFFERHGHLTVGRDPLAGRGKVVTLTAEGLKTKARFARVLEQTEDDWQQRFGPALSDLRVALQVIVGENLKADSPLFAGLEPLPGGWRAAVRRPETLPHYPMVLHRGGYPDGS